MHEMSSPKVHTPRPTPLFFQPPLTFSTKKERGQTPKDGPPPKPPIKSAPPISRIFPRKQLLKALPVSFKSPEKSILSPHYNASNKELFFDQCFDIECKIGIGSFGEVFKVRSKEDGALYAVKRSRQRFRGESDRHRKLEEVDKHEFLPSHQNCVGFVRAWEEKQHLYIQTELCKTSLNVFAEENHDIPEKLIWNYLVDLLMAVKHLHDHDLVHMDIKMENIFLSKDNVCKLGDFGLVVDLTKDVEVREAQEGDPKYLAPELMVGQFGKPADIFSLGITILELASDLDLPRGGDLWHQLRSGVLPEEFLSGISNELKEIIRWMMEPDPSKRPTVDQVLGHELVSKVWKERLLELSTIKTIPHNRVPSPNPIEGRTATLTTPTSEDISKHPPDWDHSFSDDDLLDHGGHVSLHNNSIGVLLDYSTSSEESLRNSFAVPSILPRKAVTTPTYKRRQVTESRSGSSESPSLFNPMTGNIYSSSPVNSTNGCAAAAAASESSKSSIAVSPLMDSDMEIDDEQLHHDRLNVEPKNLMKAFESTLLDEAPD